MKELVTLAQVRTWRYGIWAGRPKGAPYREGFCAESVPDGGRSSLFHQCRRKNGYGPEKLYCHQHAKFFE